MSLKSEDCLPDVQALSQAGIAQLLPQVPAWTRKGQAIEREFEFEDFYEAMIFVEDVADLAAEQDHHPDILISYNRVHLTLSTHKVGGLSRNDFIMAAKIDDLIEEVE